MLGALFDLRANDAVGLEVHDHKLALFFEKAVDHALQEHRVVRVQRGKIAHRPQQRETVFSPYRLRIFANTRGKVALQKSDDHAHIDGVRLLVRQLALRAQLFDLLAHTLLVRLTEEVKILHHKMQRRAPFRACEGRFTCKEFWFT